MAKKVIGQASKSQKKIPKNNTNINHDHHNKKQQLNSLIKFLKPKVYITDSSSFKNLVQQLTGNGSSSPISSPPPPDHHHDQRLESIHHQEYSQELSIDSSQGSMPSSVNTFDQPLVQEQYSFSTSLLDSCNNSIGASQETDFSAEYMNIESWLLEMDSYNSSYHEQYEGSYVPLIHEQVSVDDYGYDLSSLL